MWWLVAACVTDREEPRPPEVVTIRAVDAIDEEEVARAQLAELFPLWPAGVPEPLYALAPRMDGQDARAVLDAAREPEALPTDDGAAVGARLADGPAVKLRLGGPSMRLLALEVSLPQDFAATLLGERWGPPTATDLGPDGELIHRWKGDPWSAALTADGVLTFQESASRPARRVARREPPPAPVEVMVVVPEQVVEAAPVRPVPPQTMNRPGLPVPSRWPPDPLRR